MRMRAWLLLPLLMLVALVAWGQPPANMGTGGGLFTHRDAFSGKEPAWAVGDANVGYAEKDHRIVTDRYFNAPSSEYLKVEAKPGNGRADAEFLDYTYATPPTPIGETTAASVRVRSFRAGIQLRARVVLPRERDPKNPNAAFTTILQGPSYAEEKVRLWDQLRLNDAAEQLR
ncbi:MAG: hypothetical protein ACRCZF_05285, partial [Gemmataceae bacterium]